ncbi:alpha/beta hydrolase [Nitriliruptoraceae bacterium ZYF776]|nr:alpha/beta hydrolase [Profundirhabdus halotolerans]
MHTDWGERTARWAGIRSETVSVDDTEVHVLRAAAAPDAPADAPTQLLVHGLGGSSSNWLEVLSALTAHGPVLAPDLPGFGRTQPPRPSAARTGVNARFLRRLLAHEGLDRVVVHGNSMGGLLSVLLADLAPDRVERLVLVDPALPAPVRSVGRIPARTLARFAPFLVPPLGKALLGYSWRRFDGATLYEQTAEFLHADTSRLSPEITALGAEHLDWGRDQPWRLDGFTTAATSVVTAMTVGQRSLGQAIARVQAPTLVVWGDQDRLVGRHVIDHLADRRPDWEVQVLPGVGHVPMLEVPGTYLEVVGDWFGGGLTR